MGKPNVVQAVAGGLELVGNFLRSARLRNLEGDVRDAQDDLDADIKDFDDYNTKVQSGTVTFDGKTMMATQGAINDDSKLVAEAQRALDECQDEEALWQAGEGAANLAMGMGYGDGGGADGSGGGGSGGDNGDVIATALLAGAAGGALTSEVLTEGNRRRRETSSTR